MRSRDLGSMAESASGKRRSFDRAHFERVPVISTRSLIVVVAMAGHVRSVFLTSISEHQHRGRNTAVRIGSRMAVAPAHFIGDGSAQPMPGEAARSRRPCRAVPIDVWRTRV